MTARHHQLESPWPHRIAVALVCATFPLIWVGGLVTTYDAGMAVPDWPTTYGYNLFLYPWQTWLFGPWDLFIEHGHRLLGALVGMITIGLLATFWRCDERRWLRLLAVVALLAVIGQGLLGGARVVFDRRQLALIHGCVGPCFFAFAVALAAFTSRYWRQPVAAKVYEGGGRLHRLAMATSLLALVQLVLGAHLRHVPVGASYGSFRTTVWFHLLVAAILAGHVLWLAWTAWRGFGRQAHLRWPALALVLLLVVQLGLGAATWVVKYSWPAWAGGLGTAASYTIDADGALQALVVTAHVATGSLILATSVLVFLRSMRLVRSPAQHAGTSLLRTELAA